VVSVESDQQDLEGKTRNVRNQEAKRLLTALYGAKCRTLCYDKFLQVRPGRWIEKHAAATEHQSEKSNQNLPQFCLGQQKCSKYAEVAM
jgi:hypothetical protein